MVNPVLILTHNCLGLTIRCVESVRMQDVPTEIFIIDNGSTDRTTHWLKTSSLSHLKFDSNHGVSAGWNMGLTLFFEKHKADHVLVLNNDTELPPFFYSKLLSYDLPFVTGISIGEIKDHPDSWTQPVESPDFSAFLIRRDCWEKVGPFDEAMKFYASDNDFHIRAHQAGLKLMNAGVPFYHERSSTLRNADENDRAVINNQAKEDRAVFRKKYGCWPWEPEYQEFFK